MTEDWAAGVLLRILSNLPQSMHSQAADALFVAAATSYVWVPAALALWCGVLLACVYAVMVCSERGW